jgi:hypothetical protein
MATGDRTIYTQFRGKMTKIADPTCPADRVNFVITYQGRDWSGFRTLTECEAQFPSLEQRDGDHFEVVQR